jgi:Putative transposase
LRAHPHRLQLAETAIAGSVRGAARAEWLAARQAELLPVPYFHVVFTLPPAAAEIAFQNKQAVYGLLMRAAAQALMTLAAERLGATIGLIAVLHTWRQTLTHHPHVHCLVTGGGVALDGRRWVACKPNFLLSVRALSNTFRRLFLDGLEAAFRRSELGFFGDLVPLAAATAFAKRVRALRQSAFVVYAKPPFGGADARIGLSRPLHASHRDRQFETCRRR